MTINFTAKHMQGYNNPNISTISAEIDNNDQFSKYPSFEDLEHALSQGVVPILVCHYASSDSIGLYYLFNIADDAIIFIGIAAGGMRSAVFRRGSDKPVIN